MTLTEKKRATTKIIKDYKTLAEHQKRYLKDTKEDIRLRQEGKQTKFGYTLEDLRFEERDLKYSEQTIEMMTEYREYLDTLKKKPKETLREKGKRLAEKRKGKK